MNLTAKRQYLHLRRPAEIAACRWAVNYGAIIYSKQRMGSDYVLTAANWLPGHSACICISKNVSTVPSTGTLWKERPGRAKWPAVSTRPAMGKKKKS